MLVQAVIWMNLALVFYTWAVFSGRRQGLHRKHLIIFGIGLLCDYLGTHQMNLFARAYGKAPEWHNITGIASLGGMAFHFRPCPDRLAGPPGRSGQPRVPSRQPEHLHLLADRLFQRSDFRYDENARVMNEAHHPDTLLQ